MPNTFGKQFKDVRLLDIPGYLEWSRKYADEYPALIAHLDATSMMLTEEDLTNGIGEDVFAEMLDDLKVQCGE